MEFKPTYTKAEVEELVAWFEKNEYPHSLEMGDGITIEDTEKTVRQLSHLALTQHENRNFCGPINLLFRIKEKCEATINDFVKPDEE